MAFNYIALQINSDDEVIMALLSAYSFESFEEVDSGLIGYIREDAYKEEQDGIHSLLDQHQVTYSSELIKPTNWNEEWEKRFQPVIIEDFLAIRAEFHPSPDGVAHDIIINPKMAFGTGHHETTYMMSLAMKEINFQGKKVFDYGCGTGILAILASQLGAAEIDAIDIEEESYLNTLENADVNNIQNIHADQATLASFDGRDYDIILANINRQVLLDSSAALHDMLNDQGYLLLSGILKEDLDLVLQAYQNAGFSLSNTLTRGNWMMLKLMK